MPSNHLIVYNPLLLLPSIFPSINIFSSESVLQIRWPKYWSFSFNISPSNECSGLISFRIYWLNHLAVQGTLRSLLQHHSSKTSVLQCSAFFIVHLSHPYMTNGKTIAFTRWAFVGKVMSLLFNMLSRLVITFLPSSKCLNFMAAITICSYFGAPQNKVNYWFHYTLGKWPCLIFQKLICDKGPQAVSLPLKYIGPSGSVCDLGFELCVSLLYANHTSISWL